MKILHLVTQQEAGGAQRVALLLREGLEALGADGEVWFLYTKRPAFEAERGWRSLSPGRPGPVGAMILLSRLWRELRSARPDALVTHTHYANVLGCVIGRAARVPCRIAVQHAPLTAHTATVRFLDRVAARLGMYTANVFVSESSAASATAYPDRYRSLVHVIPNPVGPPTPTTSRAETRASLGVPADAPLVLAVGRLAAQKDHQTLLEAATHLTDTHVVVVGEGELRSALERQRTSSSLEGRVHLVGEVGPNRVADLMGASDVFALPSRWEAMPLALMEAAVQGLALVVSDLPEHRELMGDAARYVAVGDPTALAEALADVSTNAATREHLATAARRRSRSFSTERAARRYLELMPR